MPWLALKMEAATWEDGKKYGGLRDQRMPDRQGTGPQPYSHKKLDSTNNLPEFRRGISIKHPGESKQLTRYFGVCETLRREVS